MYSGPAFANKLRHPCMRGLASVIIRAGISVFPIAAIFVYGGELNAGDHQVPAAARRVASRQSAVASARGETGFEQGRQSAPAARERRLRSSPAGPICR